VATGGMKEWQLEECSGCNWRNIGVATGGIKGWQLEKCSGGNWRLTAASLYVLSSY